MPVFSHVLVLKNGRALAAGKKSAILTAGNLSAAFAARTRLRKSKGRYALVVEARKRGVV